MRSINCAFSPVENCFIKSLSNETKSFKVLKQEVISFINSFMLKHFSCVRVGIEEDGEVEGELCFVSSKRKKKLS